MMIGAIGHPARVISIRALRLLLGLVFWSLPSAATRTVHLTIPYYSPLWVTWSLGCTVTNPSARPQDIQVIASDADAAVDVGTQPAGTLAPITKIGLVTGEAWSFMFTKNWTVPPAGSIDRRVRHLQFQVTGVGMSDGGFVTASCFSSYNGPGTLAIPLQVNGGRPF